jgi:hypothetical protein
MKTTLIILFISSLTFLSCKKDYTCNCDANGSIPSETYTISAKKESDAKATCESYADNTGGVVTCTLQ